MMELLTKKELAKLLKVSENTVSYWVHKKQIPFLKLGKGKNATVRFDYKEIEAWLKKDK